MGFHGRLVAAIEFKAGGDLFHELFATRPHHISQATPKNIQGCELLEGEFGKQGSIIHWSYTHDGKKKTAKEVVQEIDEKNKRVVFKVIEGDLMEEFQDFIVSIHIETKNGLDMVTWTMDYKTLTEEVEHPISLLAFLIDTTKDIETHHL